jgi:hypothetical protein
MNEEGVIDEYHNLMRVQKKDTCFKFSYKTYRILLTIMAVITLFLGNLCVLHVIDVGVNTKVLFI